MAKTQPDKIPRKFVLVHGAWHGGWCWRPVAEYLRHAGYEVFTPTLTGLGERAHLLSPDISINTHVTDIESVILAEELQNVTLVGHSYGGLIITGVAARQKDKIRNLVYLDALFPKKNHSYLDEIPVEQHEQLFSYIRKGYRMPPAPPHLFGIPDDSEMGKWLKRELTDHPFSTFTEKLSFGLEDVADLARSFILCTHPKFGEIWREAETLRQSPGWQFHELDTGHDAMILKPEAVATLILNS